MRLEKLKDELLSTIAAYQQDRELLDSISSAQVSLGAALSAVADGRHRDAASSLHEAEEAITTASSMAGLIGRGCNEHAEGESDER